MRRSLVAPALMVLVLAIVGALVAPGSGAGAAAAADDDPGKVLVVAMPRLTWELVDEYQPPTLMHLYEQSAVASLSVRTTGAATSPGEAYLSLSAGNRATSDRGVDGVAVQRDEVLEEGTPDEIYERRTGVAPTGEVLQLGFPILDKRNEALLYGTEVGALGEALESAQRSAATIGNADTDTIEGQDRRWVALMGMDRDGQIARGTVSDELLVVDQTAPFGIRTDAEVLTAAFRSAWAESDLVIVEMSDLDRAERFRVESTEEQGDRLFGEALAEADAMLASMLEDVHLEEDLVIVLGPTSPLSDEQLTVFAMAGRGVEPGLAESNSTRRPGYVQLTDVAPTILDFFGVEVPSAMIDARIFSSGGGTPDQTELDEMIATNQKASYRDAATGPITVAYIVFVTVVMILAMACLARLEMLRGLVSFLALMVLAFPTCTYLSGLFRYDALAVDVYGAVLFAASAALAALAWWVGRSDPMGPPVVLGLAMVGMFLFDLALGAELQMNTVFGYSPIVAGRFAGLGNQAFALLCISALLSATGGVAWWRRWHAYTDTQLPSWLVSSLVAYFGLLVLFIGFPSLGSDVGGVLASVPAFAVAGFMLTGRRVAVRTFILILVATCAVLAVFALVDLAQPAESRTHLGRFVATVFEGDAGMVLERKLSTNIRILVSSVWTLIVPGALAFIAYLTWRPGRTLRALRRRYPGYGAFGVSSLVAGLLGMALNDSGVAVPAMMLAVGLAYTAYLAVRLERETASVDSPEVVIAPAMDDGDRGNSEVVRT
ncbi:MAG: hypothetical protein EDR02_01145 [Actinobacteria bacterium]|nr:MAG: hypothetical protein EDR02_01145 [Actinomycetota bacterium]RIK05567.1 MAG: hypothetical protein DCC48_09780 [Acidobacteriota bacterium]